MKRQTTYLLRTHKIQDSDVIHEAALSPHDFSTFQKSAELT